MGDLVVTVKCQMNGRDSTYDVCHSSRSLKLPEYDVVYEPDEREDALPSPPFVEEWKGEPLAKLQKDIYKDIHSSSDQVGDVQHEEKEYIKLANLLLPEYVFSGKGA